MNQFAAPPDPNLAGAAGLGIRHVLAKDVFLLPPEIPQIVPRDGDGRAVRPDASGEGLRYGDPGRDPRTQLFFKGGFWKVRELGARIAVPESLAGRIGSDRASVSVSGNNLSNLWREQEYIFGQHVSDPEFGSAGQVGSGGAANWFTSPPMSSVSVTLNASDPTPRRIN